MKALVGLISIFLFPALVMAQKPFEKEPIEPFELAGSTWKSDLGQQKTIIFKAVEGKSGFFTFNLYSAPNQVIGDGVALFEPSRKSFEALYRHEDLTIEPVSMGFFLVKGAKVYEELNVFFKHSGVGMVFIRDRQEPPHKIKP